MEDKYRRALGKGVMGELAVATDLIARGYEVFRALGNYESFDLIAHKDGVLLRVQVKAGVSATITPGKQDIVAWANLEWGNISYDPELDVVQKAHSDVDFPHIGLSNSGNTLRVYGEKGNRTPFVRNEVPCPPDCRECAKKEALKKAAAIGLAEYQAENKKWDDPSYKEEIEEEQRR